MPTFPKHRRNLLRLVLPFAALLLGWRCLPAHSQEATPKTPIQGAHAIGAIPDWKTLQAPYAYDAQNRLVSATQSNVSSPW